MYTLSKFFFIFFNISFCFICYSNEKYNTVSAEVLNVKHFDNLQESLSPSVVAKINNASYNNGDYQFAYAKNNGSISIKNKKNTISGTLASNTFENNYSTNTVTVPGPTDKNAVFEFLYAKEKKESFSDIAFIDSSTIATMSYTKKNAYLLLIDISNNPMQVTSRLCVPLAVYNHSEFIKIKEKFYIEPETHKIIIPVQKSTESIDNDGNLTWKKSKTATSGIWIITPIKNEDKRWVINNSQVSVNYFENESLSQKGKNATKINTAHSDDNGNIWMSFTNGIAGVLPTDGETYGNQALLYNFNIEASWYNDMIRNYKELLYTNLKSSNIEETDDTVKLKKMIYNQPDAYGHLYLENSRYTVYSNLEKEKNRMLDSNSYFENPEILWKYVHLNLDIPTSKKKRKLTDYFGFKLKNFQTIQNSITSGNDNAVYMVTNLGLHKLSYNTKTNSINVNWSTPYKNSFLRAGAEKTASSKTTPVFIEDKNEVVISDNNFPQVNLLILDAKTGRLKQQFSLFEHGYGSACENAVAYSSNSIVVGNTYGNGNEVRNTDNIPANGIMKFYSSAAGNWKIDFDWNKLHYYTPANTAVPKISAADERVYIYHKTEEAKEWQVSGISLNKADKFNPILFSLQPDFKGVVKTDLNNLRSNFTFGPNKSLYIGTSGGLMRIQSE